MSEQASFQRSDTQRKGDDTTKQIYAISAPKILLETLTARSTTLIFAITYIAFVVGFSTDINLAYRGFTSLDTNLLGVGNNQNFWNGTITSLSNVIAISLSVQQTNFSNVFLNNVSSAASIYDAQIWACYLPDGCGRNFAYNGRHDGPNYWHEVLSTKSQSINIPSASVQDSTVKRMLVPPTFQNQESIPARGKVRSYFISVNYTDNPEGLFSSSAALSTEPSTIYTVNILARSGSTVMSGTFAVILLIIVSITLTSFIHVMNRQKKEWLTEQKWVCYYLSALILFINPIYCVIVWQDNVSPMVVFAYYFVDAMAQASFLVVWLLFADNIGRKAVSPLHFYGPKILLGFSIFTTTIVALVYQFPSVSPTSSVNSDRSPVQAVSNWSLELQRSFSGVSIAVLLLMAVWTIYWLTTLFLTGRKLRSLPYMSTRYLQLSYRFFLLQAYLLAAYFVFQHYFVIFFLLREAATGRIPTIVELTDYLNTLSRQQTQQYGKVIFLTVYALLITYLFLPASLVDNDLATALASTYVLTEKEGKVVVKSRRASISNISSAVAGAVKKIVDTKAEVFCVETAIAFCNISYETYYDPANLKTGSAYDIKNMDIKKYGYKLVCTIYRPENETFCVIARHETLNKLVVGFRGSTCTKHWTLNLKGDQCALHLPLLDELDKIDGLGTDGVDCVDRIYPNHSATAIDPHRSTVNGLFRNVDMEQPSEREPTFIRPSSLTQNALSGKSASLWSIPVPKHTSLLRATSCNTWKSDISGRDEGDSNPFSL